MSRIAFREVVTMRTAEPVFKDGALERFLSPAPKDTPRRDRTSVHEGSLVPSGASAQAFADPMMQRHMQHQGRSIDQISTSVNHLQDTMTDLKHSFTSLRIELNGSNRHVGENGNLNSHGFDMISTVLKELKSKSDEIEKLKLEIEALKLKNRYMEERKPNNGDYLSTMDGAMPEVQSPGLLQAGRKRAWPDAFTQSGAHTVADSQAEEDMIDDLPLTNAPTYLVRLPISDSQPTTKSRAQSQFHDSLAPSIEQHGHHLNADTNQEAYSQPSPSKRLRLTQASADPTYTEPHPEKRRPGRPRKSVGPPGSPNNAQAPGHSAAGAAETVETKTSVQVPLQTTEPSTQPKPRGRPRRSTTSQSVKSELLLGAESTGISSSAPENGQDRDYGEQASSTQVEASSESNVNGNATSEETPNTREEKRKAKIAARDVMARMAMQREEVMETDEAR